MTPAPGARVARSTATTPSPATAVATSSTARPGDDTIFGNLGDDTIDGGAGEDRINVIGGGRDVVRCGPGKDRVLADSHDPGRGRLRTHLPLAANSREPGRSQLLAEIPIARFCTAHPDSSRREKPHCPSRESGTLTWTRIRVDAVHRAYRETYGTVCGMRRTTIYLPDDLKLALERTAAAQGKSEAEVVRHALDRRDR